MSEAVRGAAEGAAIVLKKASIRLDRLIGIAFAPFAGQFAEKDIRIELNVPHTLAEIYCDIAKTAWVLTIFFSNAMRYTPQWGRLTVNATQLDKAVRITVENSGYGVPLERLQRMFERSENYDTPEFGQGLALILAREIIESHGGRIGVESEQGVMTRFYCELPLTYEKENL